MEQINSYLKNTWVAVGILILITVLVYFNSLQNGFVIEDPIYITNWELTQSLGNIPQMFAGDTAPTGNYGIYRPVRAVFYAVSYAIFGGENPLPYHVQALLVHLIITALIFLIALKIFSSNEAMKQSSNFLSFITALLFGLHPVHTEPVNYLTANFDAISYIFFFASFYFYLKFTEKLNPKPFTLYAVSLVFAALAFFHFEMTLTLPFLIILYDVCFKFKSLRFLKSLKLLKPYLPYFSLAGIFLFLRIFVFHMTVRGEYLGGSFYLTMLTMVKAVIKYITLLIFPNELSINPIIAEGINSWVHPLAPMDKILSQTIFDRDIIFYLVIIAGLIAAAYKCYKKFPAITFGIFWFFISILPVLYIIPQGPILQERYIYIASFGFILMLTFGIQYLINYNFPKEYKEIIRPAAMLILAVLLVGYGARTFTRNAEWKNSFTVWSTLAKQSPGDVIANFSTGNMYAAQNQYDEAIKYYNQALAIEPRLHEVHFGLGEVYSKTGNLDQAAVQYQQALTINPEFVDAKEKLDEVNKSDKADIWKECKIGEILVFSCPEAWENIPIPEGTKLSDSNMTIEITAGLWDQTQNPEEFVKTFASTPGSLINQGLANFLNADVTYVKVFQLANSSPDASPSAQTAENQKLQFFLFKGDRLVKILVYPAGDPKQMEKFDRLASSIQFPIASK